jgi:hypothetical protein
MIESTGTRSGAIGAPPHLHSAVVPIGPRVLAAVIEEADVVVLLLERLDLLDDEGRARAACP